MSVSFVDRSAVAKSEMCQMQTRNVKYLDWCIVYQCIVALT